jgi:exosome complex component RRP42
MTSVLSDIRKDFIHKLAASGKRADERAFDEFREFTVRTGFVTSAEGSARVTLGNTEVLAGIKIQKGTPFPDTPAKGVMMTNIELIPMASPDFESGPPREPAIELSRVVDRGIRESGCINFDKLCIKEGEEVWMVFIDVQILNYDGNLFDVCELAGVAALKNAMVPLSNFEDMEGESYPLPVENYPLSCTFVKLGEAMVVDPSLEEEDLATARLTVTTDNNGDIRAMQKGGSGSFTPAEIDAAIEIAQVRGREIREQFLL